jgi:hypothetical protein
MTLASVATQVTMKQSTLDFIVDGESSGINYYTGWCASPVPAAQVVNVMVEALNPQSAPSSWYNVPAFLGFATQAGPNSPDGALLFASPFGAVLGTEPYGVLVWYNE